MNSTHQSSAMLIPAIRSMDRIRKLAQADKSNVPRSDDNFDSCLERAIVGSFDDLSELAFHMELENPSCNDFDYGLQRSKGCFLGSGIVPALESSCQHKAGTANSNSADPVQTKYLSPHSEID
jgi:hypothetical protein